MKNDIEIAADGIAEAVRPKLLRRQQIQARMKEGLAPSGKKLRRNARCPCGSGMKFKKCCLHGLREKVNEGVTRYQNSRIERYLPNEDSNQHEHDDESGTSCDGGNADDACEREDVGN